jgi:hypothetical protein
VTGLRVNDDLGAGGVKRVGCRKTEQEKSDEKAAKNYHVNKNRCTLIAVAFFATGESALNRSDARAHVQESVTP